MDIEKLKQEYKTQDNRATAFPLYVQVQELVCIGVIEEGYSVICPYGDGEIKYEHNCENCNHNTPCYDDGFPEEEPEHCDNDKQFGYIWHTVEFFLTLKGAEEYIKAVQHNHGKLRTYIDCFSRSNCEMRDFLKELGFKNAT